MSNSSPVTDPTPAAGGAPAAGSPAGDGANEPGRGQRIGGGILRSVRTYLPAVTFVALLVVAWQAIVVIFDIEQFVFPTPTDVIEALFDEPSQYLEAAWYTTQEIVLGFAIAVVAGLSIAIILHLSAFLRRAILPVLIASQTIPVVVLAPVFVIIMGFGIGPKLAIVALICFFPIAVNTVDGLRGVDSSYVGMMRTLDASRFAIFRRVEFPSALPMMFTGARIGATYAAIGAVLGEWSGSTGGIGFLIQQNVPSLNTPAVFAGILVLSLIALALVALVTLIERLTIPWARD